MVFSISILLFSFDAATYYKTTFFLVIGDSLRDLFHFCWYRFFNKGIKTVFYIIAHVAGVINFINMLN